jgi:hypothetical protein
VTNRRRAKLPTDISHTVEPKETRPSQLLTTSPSEHRTISIYQHFRLRRLDHQVISKRRALSHAAHYPTRDLNCTARAVPWLRRLAAGLPPRRPGFDPGSVHVGFVVDKVARGQVFLRVLRFSPVNFIPPVLHY